MSEMASDEADVKAYVHQKWLELAADVEASIKEKWWNTLKSCYAEDSRKYHTFLHLKRMFHHMESLSNEIQSKNAVSYAIFFHDAVYDARSQENEEQSIKLYNEFASLDLKKMRNKVLNCIMSLHLNLESQK
ncbi:hypothetical protein AVEN_119654-1 [Araneus ventricosus]|uniref:Uncharacterized protein n=1 Tax=Araneus ventricosus TaxID=182803 RepID=A0A4Y2SPK9_ARAVE|nr:hypothetical protein AVEN_119654-1 [Araneus ventricosus]